MQTLLSKKAMTKNSHTTPEGYFDSLKTRLSRIPQEQDVRVSLWQKVSPHLAIAAAFIAIVTAGTAILKTFTSTGQDSQEELYNQYILSDLVLRSSNDLYQEDVFDFDDSDSEEVSQEDLVNYLIESGLTVENIEDDETEY